MERQTHRGALYCAIQTEISVCSSESLTTSHGNVFWYWAAGMLKIITLEDNREWI